MATDNIFSGLKVVDLASFIAGPGAAVILSDYGADVIKVEPPTGDLQRIVFKVPPQPRAKDNYPWHLDNRNKRGLALDLKSPRAGEILERLVGPLAFGSVYLAAGVFGGLVSLSAYPVAVTVGASGAIFGLYGLLLATAAWGVIHPTEMSIPLRTPPFLNQRYVLARRNRSP